MISRKLAQSEIGHAAGSITLQFALKVNNPDLVPETVRKLSKSVFALHAWIDKENLCYDPNTDISVFKLPEFKTLEEGCSYMFRQHHLPYSMRLGSIGHNKDTVYLNVNHLAGDGAYFQYLFKQLKEQNSSYFRNLKVDFIRSSDEVFKDQIASATHFELPPFIDPKNSRIIPRDLVGRTKDPVTAVTSRKTDLHNLQVFNKQTGKIHGLTDAQWVFLTLSSCAHNGGDISKQSCSVISDLRSYLKEYDFSNVNHFANLAVSTNVTKDNTIADMMKAFRADFNRRRATSELFGYLKGPSIPFDLKPPEGVDIELSNVGRFDLSGTPYTDLWLTSHINSACCPNHLATITYSITGNGKNELVSLNRFASEVISVREIDVIARSMHYGLENVPLNTTVGEAVDMLQDFQHNVESEFDRTELIKSE